MNYLIVGGTKGIGRALTESLHAQGHQLFVIARAPAELPSGVRFIPGDVASLTEADLSDLPETLDGLAFCPGTINLKPFARLKKDDFLADFEGNVWGAIHITQLVLSRLKKSERASVVYFSTVAVQTGMGFHASVASAKGALEGLTRSLAAELAPKIRVNCIAPSLTNTSLAEGLLNTDQKRAASADRHPLKRVGSPEDIAKAAAFLLGSESDWITGQVLGVDGGLSALRV